MNFAKPQARKALENWYKLLFLDCNMNLGALSYGIMTFHVKLTLERVGLPGSMPVYGEPNSLCPTTRPHPFARLLTLFSCTPSTGEMDSVKLPQLIRLQAWLMDPDRCPTTWPVLLRIRQRNPQFASGARPTRD